MATYSRRDFLKTAGLVGGGLMMSQNPLFAQAATGKKIGAADEINVALIGMGKEGEVLLNNMLQIEGIRFRAVCDIQPMRRRYGAGRIRGIKQDVTKNMYEDFEEMLEKEADLDAVIIATPDFWHAPQTIKCLEKGINVYCEKMMSNTIEGARSMVRAMRSSGKLCQIGHQRKSNPRYQFMHDVLLRKLNLCGTITNANGQWNRAVAADLMLPANAKLPIELLNKYGFADEHQFCNWRWFKGLGGGPISDLGAHQIDIFAWMLGNRPKSIMASGGLDFYTPANGFVKRDWEDNVMCIYEYETYQKNPARVAYQVLTTTSAGGGYFEQFMGTDGAIKMSENPAITKIFAEGRPEIAAKWEQHVKDGFLVKGAAVSDKIADSRETKALAEFGFPKTDIDNLPPAFIHMPHLVNFFDSIRGKAKLNCDAEHAFEAEAAVFKVREALDSGKKLEFTDADFTA